MVLRESSAIRNFPFPSSLQNTETRYFVLCIVALWLACGDEAIGTYTVNSAFNESVCLLSWRYCYVWLAEKLYAWTLTRSKSVKEVLTYLSLPQDFFLSFFFFPISRQKRYVKSLSLPSGIDRALRSCVTKREKWLEIHITVPSTINKLRIWYHVLFFFVCFLQTTRTSYDRNCRQPEARIGK